MDLQPVRASGQNSNILTKPNFPWAESDPTKPNNQKYKRQIMELINYNKKKTCISTLLLMNMIKLSRC